jgi:uncharacterized damage-inducible protein DinB/glutaredoxin
MAETETVETETVQFTDEIEGYWVPGCSSCLRMKEFLTRSGVAFTAINLEESPEGVRKLEHFGMLAPVVVRGERAVAGLDLVGIAELIGIEYDPPKILAPAVLRERYGVVTATATALVGQLSDDQLQYRSPDRDRTLAELASHIGSIMRCFVDVYDREQLNQALELPDPIPTTGAAIIDIALETQAMFDTWWDRFGFDDPLERVIDTFWGARTLHEVLERSVWHPMQHTRQLTYFVEERLGMAPARRLRPEDMEGLPLPEGIHAGGEGG